MLFRSDDDLGERYWFDDKQEFPDSGSAVFDFGPTGDLEHIANFLDAIRGKAKLNSEIEVGQTSAMLCHLGNIALRTSSVLKFDPKARKVLNQPDAEKLWAREYRPGWEAKI